MSEVSLAALVEEIRTEARDMTEDGEDASVIRGWANTIAAHLRKATPPAAPDEAMVRDADMFWDDSDTEQAACSIDEIVSNAYESGAEHGQVIEIQQAVRLPNVSVRFVMHESGDYGYEVIDAALTGDKA